MCYNARGGTKNRRKKEKPLNFLSALVTCALAKNEVGAEYFKVCPQGLFKIVIESSKDLCGTETVDYLRF